MDKIFRVSTFAVLFSSMCLLPQVISVYQNKSVVGLSLAFLTLDAVASILWIIYGRRIGDNATVVSSSVSLVLSAMLAVAFYIYHYKTENNRNEKTNEDDRFQFGGPVMTRGEPSLSVPNTQHYAGSQQYNNAPKEPEYDENFGGGLFGGQIVSSSMDFSQG